MAISTSIRLAGAVGAALLLVVTACRHTEIPIRMAPPGTDYTPLRSGYALTDAERISITPELLRNMTQEQVEQIYVRLSTGPMPDGPFRGDLFFPRGRSKGARVKDVATLQPGMAPIGALRLEQLGRMFWKGKAFFRSEGILRNRIEEVAILRLIVDDPKTIPKLTFDGETTWLLFPARVSCGVSRLDPSHPSVVIDYSRGPEIAGYRPVPDKLAGSEGLNIRDEVRVVRPGLYLGRAYFGDRFGLNFTLLDPAVGAPAAGAPPPIPPETRTDCTQAGKL